jgi:hypothetical protein
MSVHKTELGGDWRWGYLDDFISMESEMPRLRDGFLDCAVYLYRSEHEADEGINAGGTGFLMSVPAPEISPTAIFIYVVTNRHVVSKARFVRINRVEGGFSTIELNNWFLSETDDLAIHTIRFTGNDILYRHVSLGMVMTEEIANEIGLGIGDNVFLVGRFINHEGKQRNTPTVRFGNIAQMPSEPVETLVNGIPHQQISILADVKSIGGYSGSPVFLNENSLFKRGENRKPANKHWLVGVDWGHIYDWAPICGFDGNPVAAGHQVRMNTGMACIVPAWRLLELIMRDDLRKVRDGIIAKHAAIKAKAGATTDIAEPSAVENPSHKEDFKALLDAAARKPK